MGSAKYTTIAKGVTVTSTGTKTINGVKYYDLGGGAYIKAVNVDVKLRHQLHHCQRVLRLSLFLTHTFMTRTVNVSASTKQI